jgi:hypothetical protein
MGASMALMAFTPIRYYRTPRDLPPLTPELRDIIVGCALGDLTIVKNRGSLNAFLKFGQGAVNSEYTIIFIAYSNSIAALLLPLFGPYMFGPKTQVRIHTLTHGLVNTTVELALTLFPLKCSLSFTLYSTPRG